MTGTSLPALNGLSCHNVDEEVLDGVVAVAVAVPWWFVRLGAVGEVCGPCSDRDLAGGV
jgi:hypothetical protein